MEQSRREILVLERLLEKCLLATQIEQKKYSRFDYLRFMFPPDEIDLIVRLKNIQLEKHQERLLEA